MFITDIFVVADPNTPSFYRIEKSPQRFQTSKGYQPTVITNHLIGKVWEFDKVNEYRKKELTTLERAKRGEALIEIFKAKVNKNSSPEQIHEQMVSFLRDKSDVQGHPLHLGNRQSIDALIATHSVVYNASKMLLYVNQGPGVSGAYLGYDLRQSFEKKFPVRVSFLPSDPQVSADQFYKVKDSLKMIRLAEVKIKAGKCESALDLLQKAGNLFENHSNYYKVMGDYFDCIGEDEKAKQSWKKSLSLNPAYLQSKKYLSEKLSISQ